MTSSISSSRPLPKPWLAHLAPVRWRGVPPREFLRSNPRPPFGGHSLSEAPFLQKITWQPATQTVIYRSKPHHTTKRDFQIPKATDFLAALVDHIPPESKHTELVEEGVASRTMAA